MTEDRWLFLVYFGSVAAVLLAAMWGIRQYQRAEAALDDVDQAYRDGYEDGSGGLVLEPGGLASRGRHAGDGAADQLELWHEPGRRPAGYEMAQTMMWVEALRASPLAADPPTDERLERVVLELTETDTGWLRRVEPEQAEAWAGSADRIEQLADQMYREWKEQDL